MKSIRCNFVQKHFGIGTCSIDRSKSKLGIINIYMQTLHTLDEFYVRNDRHLKFLYRYFSCFVQEDVDIYFTSLKSYMLRLRKMDVCKFWSRDPKYDFPLKSVVLDFVNRVASEYANGCPYVPKNYTLKNIDVNAVVAPMLPVVVVPGMCTNFSVLLNWFLLKNFEEKN